MANPTLSHGSQTARLWLLAMALSLSACAAPPTEPPPTPSATRVPPSATASPSPSKTPTPTGTSTPVPTDTTVPSPTPEGQIFRDDFSGALLPGWTWENENPDRWAITSDGWLQILGEDTSLLAGQIQANTLWRDLPEGDFAITVHLQANPVADFQQAAIYIYEDIDNYITINRGFCGPCGGSGIYMDYMINGELGTYMVPYHGTDLYLRLESTETTMTGFYASSPDQWARLGRFGNYFTFRRVGLGVSNVDRQGNINSDLAGLFDFFEITRR